MKMLIDGEWRDSASGRMFPVHNPATGDVVGEAPLGGEDDVVSAIEAAGEAFPDWAAKSPRDRAKVLFLAAGEVRRRNTDLAALLTAEQGKPIREAVDEINGFANILEYYHGISAGLRVQDLGGGRVTVGDARPASAARSSLVHVQRSHGLEDQGALAAGNTMV